MIWLIPFVVLGGVLPHQAPTPPAAPVTAGQPMITGDTTHPELPFDITNNTNATVIAWTVDILVRAVNGSIVRTGIGVDGCTRFAGAIEPAIAAQTVDYASVIPPHSTAHFGRGASLPVRPSDVASIELTVRDAIFGDDTWIGDERYVDTVFQDRQRNYETHNETVAVLKDALEHHPGVEALQWALNELAKDSQNTRKEVDRINLRLALAGKMKRPAEDLLSTWIARHEAERAALDQHRHKGPRAAIK